MLSQFVLVICLFGFISNSTIRNNSFQNNGIANHFLLFNRNTQNIQLKNEQIRIKWHDIIFISMLILFFIILLICLYYQSPLINFIFARCSKTKKNNNNINEYVTVLHRTSPVKNANSMYLTVLKPSYPHHQIHGTL